MSVDMVNTLVKDVITVPDGDSEFESSVDEQEESFVEIVAEVSSGQANSNLRTTGLDDLQETGPSAIEGANLAATRLNRIELRRRISKFIDFSQIVAGSLLGSTTAEITFVNDTNCVINVSLKTIAPIVFRNRLLPGHAVTVRVPKFIYTIEVRVWTGNNEYSAVRDTLVPISFVVLTAASLAASTAARTAALAARAPAWLARVIRLGRPVVQIGRAAIATRASKEVVSSLVSGAAIRSHGWKCWRNRTFAIRGGPSAVNLDNADGEMNQYIELGEHFDGFRIVELNLNSTNNPDSN